MNIRSWNYRDYEIFSHIICETWPSFTWMSTYEEGRRKAKRYLQQCIEEATFVQVLEVEDLPVGCIVANSIYDKTGCTMKDTLAYRLVMPTFDERYERSNQRYRSVCDAMMKDANKQYDGELILFLIHPMYKRKGYGDVLFSKALNYFYDTNCSTFFLYSDTTCDHRYYHRVGMKCIKEAPLYPNKRKSNGRVFLYEGAVSSILEQMRGYEKIDMGRPHTRIRKFMAVSLIWMILLITQVHSADEPQPNKKECCYEVSMRQSSIEQRSE